MYPEAVVGVGSCFLEFVMGVDIYGIVVVFGTSSIVNDFNSDMAAAAWFFVSSEILTLSGIHELCERSNSRTIWCLFTNSPMIMRTIEFSNNSMFVCKFSNDSMVYDVIITKRMRTILKKGIISNEVTVSIIIWSHSFQPWYLVLWMVLQMVMVWMICQDPK